jgi:predicted Rossmann fold flavoprotein
VTVPADPPAIHGGRPPAEVDVAVIGAGAAGLMAAIFAGRAAREAGRPCRVIALDGAKKLGAKILVAGGGRCNVTHHEVTADAYAGSSRNAIRKVLRRFDVPETVAFFAELGVHLKREDTGKLFPTTDRARSVLDALLRAAAEAGVTIHHPWRVDAIEAAAEGEEGFLVRPKEDGLGPIHARRVILATGGRSLPKSGSDGHGHGMVRGLGHSLTDRVFPSLVPLKLAEGHPLLELSGIAVRAGVEVRRPTGKKVVRFENDLLCTHFGLSGPAALDASRWFIDAFMDDRDARFAIDWLPDVAEADLDADLVAAGPGTVGGRLRERLPERMVQTLCAIASVDPATRRGQLRRDDRRNLVRAIKELEVPVVGNRGYVFAEVTAGGVPLTEVRLETMESRVQPGLHLCGEICDVDGRIGGFNFQWAWASGYVAGRAAVAGLPATGAEPSGTIEAGATAKEMS